MVFVDGSNVFWGRRKYNELNKTNLKIDYLKLIGHLVNNRSLVRAIYYCSKPIPPNDSSQLQFYDYLRKCNVQVIEKELKTRQKVGTTEMRFVEKGVDVALATDLLGMAWEGAYDVAILVSGDGDFTGAVNRVMAKGKNVEIVSFKGSCSSELRNSSIKITYIDDIAQIIKTM